MLRIRRVTRRTYVHICKYRRSDVSTDERSHGPRNNLSGCMAATTDHWAERNKRLFQATISGLSVCATTLLATASVPRAYLKGLVSLGWKPGHEAAKEKDQLSHAFFFSRTLNRASFPGNLLFVAFFFFFLTGN